ncbi:MAG: sigma-70 family RNA polymerase sigma factor [Bacteroidota bacterium]
MSKIHLQEEELVRMLKAQDPEAFTYLYDHYCNALYGVIFRIVNDEDMAQDVLQETFVKIWKNLESYDPAKGRLFTWLVNLTRNFAIDKYRSKEFRQQSKNQSLDDSVNSINLLTNVKNKVDHIGLKETVSQLKPEYIQVIDLLYFKGYTHEEVAKEFNIPLGTVKTRIRAAIIQLREKLGVS